MTHSAKQASVIPARYTAHDEPAPSSWSAIAALALAVAGLIAFPLAIAAVLVGRATVDEIDRANLQGQTHQGRGLAVAGVMLGRFGLVVPLIALTLILMTAWGPVGHQQVRAAGPGPGAGAATQPAGPASQPAPRGARQGLAAEKTRNAANIRSIMQSFMLLATVSDDRRALGNVKERFQILVNPESADGLSLAPQILISPGEINPSYKKATAIVDAKGRTVPQIKYSSGGEVNYSYSLLNDKNPEWPLNNTNASAVLAADRKGLGIPGGPKGSIWNLDSWEGHVGWGDTHVTYEKSSIMTTWHEGKKVEKDDIFAQDEKNDALLIHDSQELLVSR